MIKFFSRWTRKFHRWIAIPTAILIPIAVITKIIGASGERLPPQIEQFQSILMLIMAISGAYLLLLPYIVKWQRNRRQKDKN